MTKDEFEKQSKETEAAIAELHERIVDHQIAIHKCKEALLLLDCELRAAKLKIQQADTVLQ